MGMPPRLCAKPYSSWPIGFHILTFPEGGEIAPVERRMPHLERSTTYWTAVVCGPFARPKIDRRKVARESFSSDATLLNVILRRGDDFRQWSIRPRDIGWDCRFLNTTTITVSGCNTLDDAIAKKHCWEAEIAAARADGWA